MNLKITLSKKWLAQTTRKKNKNTGKELPHISLFGYYDTLTFEEPQDWHSFRPGNCNLKNNDLQHEYAIRLVNSEKESVDLIGKLHDYPIVACTLIHFTDDFLKRYGKSNWEKCFLDFKNSVEAGFKILEDKSIQYLVYFALGYNDAAIIFFDKSISSINKCVEILCNLPLSSLNREESQNENQGCIISSEYTLIGYGENTDKIPEDDVVSAVMDFTCNKQYFYKGASISLKDIEAKLEQATSKGVKCEITSNMLLGIFDWRITAKSVNLKKFIKFHHQLILSNKNTLNRMETHLLLNNEEFCKTFESRSEGHNLHEETIRKKLDKNVSDAYKQFKKEYLKLEKSHHAHNRILGAIDELILQYFKIISTGHGYDVKKIVGKVIVSYLTSATAIMLYMSEDSKKEVFDRLHSKYDNITYVRFIEKSADDFRRSVNSLLFDMWRSDSIYFERQTSSHPTVGSAAKILFAYNKILIEWDEAWIQALKEENIEEDNETGFSYLLTSGGCDITENMDLFDYNHEALNKYGIENNETKDNKVVKKNKNNKSNLGIISRPIIVKIPEASLYDVKGVLIRLAHEFFHKRGNRLREDRANYYYKSICKVFAANVEHFAVSYFLRKKAQFIFENRIYTGELRKFYENENGVDYQGWLSDLDNYFVIFKRALKEGSIEKLSNKPDIKKLYELFGNEAFTFSEKLKLISDKSSDEYREAVLRLNKELFNASKEIEEHYTKYKKFKNDEGEIAQACKALIDNIYYVLTDFTKIPVTDRINGKDKNQFNLYSLNVYGRCKNLFVQKLDEVKDNAADAIQKFANTLSKFGIFTNGSGPLANIGILARADSNHIGETVWNDFVKSIKCENDETLPLLNVTELNEWVKDVLQIYKSYAEISFKETFADYMALNAFLIDNGKEDYENYLQYIFVTLFEVRNINELLYTGEYPINEDGDIGFACFLRFGNIARILWSDLKKEFKDKNQKAIELIKEYHSKVMLCHTNEGGMYSEGLYNLLMKLFESLDKYDGEANNEQYTSNLKEYLIKCKEDRANKLLIQKIKSGTELIINSKPCDNDKYADFILSNWLKIFEK